MSESGEFGVPADLVAAAIRAAEQRGEDMADVPLIALARAAGVSRSTLLRRIGGSRRALDDAVRAAGVDPGGRRPVRDRAVEAAAQLISERGLAAATLEAVAEAAECSVHSLYATFGGRDELLGAIYERYSPLRDLEGLVAEPEADLEATVRAMYRALALSFEVRAGRIRGLPVPLLVQQMIGPLAVHLLFRPAMERGAGLDLPSVAETCEVFADAFLRAVAVPGSDAVRPSEEAPCGS